jgi:predicted membrane-bound spermidine synthase
MRLRLSSLYFLFFLSGVSGLIYESVWSQYVKLILGHAAYSQALVLTIFMGSMAIGAYLTSRVIEKAQNPLFYYSLVEIIVGVFGVFFHSEFLIIEHTLFYDILPNTDNTQLANFFKSSAAILLLLPQAILLGSTFPLMSSAALRINAANSGSTIGTLYFSNSIGAGLGALLSAFILIESVGLPGTSLTAGLVNIFVGLAAWGISKNTSGTPLKPLPSGRTTPQPHDSLLSLPSLLILVSFFTGFASFLYELSWIRMLSLVLGSSVHAFELMLSAFIIGLALGSLYIKRKIDTLENPRRVLAYIQILMGLAAAATLPLYTNTFDTMSWLIQALKPTDQGYILFSIGSQLICFVIMLPATFLAGMTLPLITNLLIKTSVGEAGIGRIYAANTVGAIFGIIIASHLLIPLVSMKWTIISGAAVDIVVGLAILTLATSNLPKRITYTVSTISIVLLAAMASTKFDQEMLSSGVYRFGIATLPPQSEILFYEDGKTATISVIKHSDDSISIRTNGKTDAQINPAESLHSADEVTMTLAALIPLAMNPEIKTVANIGLGSGLTTQTILASEAIEKVDSIEIESKMIEGAKLFGSSVDKVFTDPRSHIFTDDAKSFFTSNNKRYDLIISEPSNPWVSGIGSLFSTEFYSHIKRYLNNDGLFVQWIQLYEINLENIASIVMALDENFEQYHFFNTDNANMLVVAKISADKEFKLRPLTGTHISNSLHRIGLTSSTDIATHYLGGKQLFSPVFEELSQNVNSDFFPALSYSAPISRFKNANAIDITSLHTNAIPLLKVLNNNQYPVSTSGTIHFDPNVLAQRARDIIDGKADTVPEKIQFALSIVNSLRTNCQTGMDDPATIPALQTIAGSLNPYLSPKELRNYWQQLIESCERTDNEILLTWIQLHAAIAQQHMEDVGKITDTLLSITPMASVDQYGYLYKAALLSRIAVGDAPSFNKLISRNGILPNFKQMPFDIQLLVAYGHSLFSEQDTTQAHEKFQRHNLGLHIQ